MGFTTCIEYIRYIHDMYVWYTILRKMCDMLHEHKGVSAGGGCAPSHAEREAEGNL